MSLYKMSLTQAKGKKTINQCFLNNILILDTSLGNITGALTNVYGGIANTTNVANNTVYIGYKDENTMSSGSGTATFRSVYGGQSNIGTVTGNIVNMRLTFALTLRMLTLAYVS